MAEIDNSIINDLAEAMYDSAVAKVTMNHNAEHLDFDDLPDQAKIPFRQHARSFLDQQFDLTAAQITEENQ